MNIKLSKKRFAGISEFGKPLVWVEQAVTPVRIGLDVLPRRLKRGEPRASRGSERCSGQPLRDSDQVAGNGRDEVLQMGFRLSDVATLSQTTAADGLLMGAFNPGAIRVVLTKCAAALRRTPLLLQDLMPVA
jgi:hypothetical protein